jgi:hypothetical protein
MRWELKEDAKSEDRWQSSEGIRSSPVPGLVPDAPTEGVQGYTTKRGQVVQPYERTIPDGTRDNNFSTKGNMNPFTGKNGDKPTDAEAGDKP